MRFYKYRLVCPAPPGHFFFDDGALDSCLAVCRRQWDVPHVYTKSWSCCLITTLCQSVCRVGSMDSVAPVKKFFRGLSDFNGYGYSCVTVQRAPCQQHRDISPVKAYHLQPSVTEIAMPVFEALSHVCTGAMLHRMMCIPRCLSMTTPFCEHTPCLCKPLPLWGLDTYPGMAGGMYGVTRTQLVMGLLVAYHSLGIAGKVAGKFHWDDLSSVFTVGDADTFLHPQFFSTVTIESSVGPKRNVRGVYGSCC